MNVFRNAALVAFVVASGAAGAADTEAVAMITGAVTPGVYGRVDAARKPCRRSSMNSRCSSSAPRSNKGVVEPVYLHVPPDHAKNWKKYCSQYKACDKPVYFVKSAEYEPGYEPPKPRQPAARSASSAAAGKTSTAASGRTYLPHLPQAGARAAF